MSKAKASFKGVIFFLLILAVIAGVVCGIIFWPKRPAEIKKNIESQVNIVFNDKNNESFSYNFEKFGEYANAFFDKDSHKREKYEHDSIALICSGLETYFEYISYTFEFADFSKYDKASIANAKKGLIIAESKANEISEFVKAKNETLTKAAGDSRSYADSDALLVWLDVLSNFEKMLDGYKQATENISYIYEKNVNKGVYCNTFGQVAVEGVGYYLNYFHKHYKAAGTETYYNMANNFKNFTEYFDEQEKGRPISNYSSSSSEFQTRISMINDFNSKFENYTLKQFVEEGMDYSKKDFSNIQKGFCIAAEQFYTGGLDL